MGANAGDAVEFNVDVPAAGDYTFTFRYAQSDSTGDRPMTLTVDGTDAAPSFHHHRAPAVGRLGQRDRRRSRWRRVPTSSAWQTPSNGPNHRLGQHLPRRRRGGSGPSPSPAPATPSRSTSRTAAAAKAGAISSATSRAIGVRATARPTASSPRPRPRMPTAPPTRRSMAAPIRRSPSTSAPARALTAHRRGARLRQLRSAADRLCAFRSGRLSRRSGRSGLPRRLRDRAGQRLVRGHGRSR